jgi:hypothetical protein
MEGMAQPSHHLLALSLAQHQRITSSELIPPLSPCITVQHSDGLTVMDTTGDAEGFRFGVKRDARAIHSLTPEMP